MAWQRPPVRARLGPSPRRVADGRVACIAFVVVTDCCDGGRGARRDSGIFRGWRGRPGSGVGHGERLPVGKPTIVRSALKQASLAGLRLLVGPPAAGGL